MTTSVVEVFALLTFHLAKKVILLEWCLIDIVVVEVARSIRASAHFFGFLPRI